MLMFLIGILLLAAGYRWYGKFVEKILAPTDRPTPATVKHDGVDFIILPHWKNMLIQLLNIAGIGPVVGVVLGIKFGSIVFLLIPVGNIIGGAVHDFIAGMASLRNGGANLPALIRMNMGKTFYLGFSVFMCALLLLVVAVFINVPAALCNNLVSGSRGGFWFFVAGIFLYYIVATIFPVDKIIGKLYPLFGLMLLAGTFAILLSILFQYSFHDPDMFIESKEFHELINGFNRDNPILPCLFVTIACGILSGFHATQSPIIARTMASEHQARPAFYGMMVVEGVIAMIWAAAGYVIYNHFPALFNTNPNSVLAEITKYFLGNYVGSITILAVIILAITSGDTALRSLRLSCAEIFHIEQRPIRNRIVLSLPLIAIVTVLLWWSNKDAKSFGYLWNYFAWGNQVLAACTLNAMSIWLIRQKKACRITLIPGMFMTYIVTTYIFWVSPEHHGPYGFGLPLTTATAIGIVAAAAAGLALWIIGKRHQEK